MFYAAVLLYGCAVLVKVGGAHWKTPHSNTQHPLHRSRSSGTTGSATEDTLTGWAGNMRW